LYLLLLAACFAAWTAAPAGAWNYKNTGSPGRLQVLRVYGFTSQANPLPNCVFCDNAMDYIEQHQHHADFAAYTPARYIWRAPFSGVQVATVQYRLFHKNYCSDFGITSGTCDDGFKWFKTDTGRYTIGADAQGTTVPAWADYIDANMPDGVMFGMDIVVTWRSAAGAFLGQTYLDYNARGDYFCLTTLCGIGSNAKYGAWIYVHS
jgi:hypothetical protein